MLSLDPPGFNHGLLACRRTGPLNIVPDFVVRRKQRKVDHGGRCLRSFTCLHELSSAWASCSVPTKNGRDFGANDTVICRSLAIIWPEDFLSRKVLAWHALLAQELVRAVIITTLWVVTLWTLYLLFITTHLVGKLCR